MASAIGPVRSMWLVTLGSVVVSQQHFLGPCVPFKFCKSQSWPPSVPNKGTSVASLGDLIWKSRRSLAVRAAAGPCQVNHTPGRRHLCAPVP